MFLQEGIFLSQKQKVELSRLALQWGGKKKKKRLVSTTNEIALLYRCIALHWWQHTGAYTVAGPVKTDSLAEREKKRGGNQTEGVFFVRDCAGSDGSLLQQRTKKIPPQLNV